MNQTNPFEESERKRVADVSAFLRENPEIRSEIEDQDCTEFPPKDDREKTNSERNWPDPPDPQAYYGLAGDIVEQLSLTRNRLQWLLIQTLVCFGNLIGRTAHFVAEGSQHFLNLFVVLVGVTSVGRKGSSWAQVLRLFRAVDPQWAEHSVQSGLSSGEGLIWAVRDAITKREPLREKGRVVEYQDVETDAGIADKRLLVFESEFASPLRMMTRDGNILSRDASAWTREFFGR